MSDSQWYPLYLSLSKHEEVVLFSSGSKEYSLLPGFHSSEYFATKEKKENCKNLYLFKADKRLYLSNFLIKKGTKEKLGLRIK